MSPTATYLSDRIQQLQQEQPQTDRGHHALQTVIAELQHALLQELAKETR